MERGLLWLPLLATFIGLAWFGWHEYRKVETYQQWATQFERSKYDIYAVLGYLDNRIVWGQPTRQGPVGLQELDLATVQQIDVSVGDQVLDIEMTPFKTPAMSQGSIVLTLHCANPADVESTTSVQPVSIPFTELHLALDWANYLKSL